MIKLFVHASVSCVIAILLYAVGLLDLEVRAEQSAPTQADTQAVETKNVDQVFYPGPQPPSEKVESSIGPLKVRLYGTLLMNVSVSDTNVAGQDVPLWSFPDGSAATFPDSSTRRNGNIHDLIFTARQSVFGLNLSAANPSANAWVSTARVELDFFGVRPSDTFQPGSRVFNQPRLRLAYFQIEKGMWKVTAGQDRAIIAPLDPVSLSHVAVPLAATAGNLWGWLPQVRLDHTHKFGRTATLLQFGVLRPQFGDPALRDLPAPGTAVDSNFSGFGERSSHPFYQARMAVSHPMQGSTATIGAAAHYGRESVGSDRNLDSWAFALDLTIPLQSRLTLHGEGFVGSNLIPFQGGVLQGVAAVRPGRIQRIGAGGGWAELTIYPTPGNKNIVYLGGGTDDPRNANLLPGTNRSKNSVVWASYFRKMTDQVSLGLEWSNWQTRTIAFVGLSPGPRGPFGSANVFNTALAYQF